MSTERALRLQDLSRVAAGLGGGIGALVLAGGWARHVGVLHDPIYLFDAMKPNTALGLAMTGLAVWVSRNTSRAAQAVSSICAWLLGFIGAATMVEYSTGANLRIDEMLFRGIAWPGILPSRMAFITAVIFVLMAGSLLLVNRKRWLITGQMLACAAGVLCVFNLIGQLYGVKYIFGIASRTGMASHTAIGFAILSAGILLLHPARGLMKEVTSDAPGGSMARRLLPAALFVPVVLGWLRWQGQAHGLYDTSFGLALFASSNIVVFTCLIWTNARLLNRSDTERSKVESKMRASESRYQTLVESLPQLVWTCLPDGQCDYLSQQWITYTGISEEDQLGYGWVEQICPEDRAHTVEVWEKAVGSAGKFEVEYRIRDGKGEYRWFRALAIPFSDAEGTITKWFGTSTDIQILKTTEAALRESEATFRQLADSMPQMVWTAKPNGDVDYYNQRWYDFTGMTFAETKDWGWKAVLLPEDLQNCIDHWTHSYTTGAFYEVEYRFRRASDGVYRWHLGRAVPIRNSTGEIVRWFGTCTDIEDYKQAEEKIRSLNEGLEQRVEQRTAELARANDDLAAARTQLQSVLNAATQVSIIATDTDGVIRLFNSGAERMLQYRAAEFVDIQTPATIHDKREMAERSAELSLELGRPVEGFGVFVELALRDGSETREWTYFRKDGSSLAVNLAVTAVRNAQGTVTGFLGIATDISARKSLERDLRLNNEDLAEQTRRAEDANRTKSDFLASMSHEIRTPMNSILGMADLLWDTELDEDQRRYVEVFRRAGSNLMTLINDILDLSKIESGHFELERIDFDLEELVERTMEMLRPRAQAKHIDLVCRMAAGTASSLTGDPTRLQQILLNLLGNAVKFTKEGEVKLTVGPDPLDTRRFRFEVSDTGIGIRADKIAAIFNDFTQAESSTTRQFGGTGLGLGIARRLVTSMGGQLEVSSEFGKGSRFFFSAILPRSSQNMLRRPEQVTGLAGRKVLIVDDNRGDREILADMCHGWGMDTSVCMNATTALAALRKETPFDLIILDRLTPAMDGFEFVSAIRTESITAPILMTTSDNAPGDETRSQQLGVAGYAVKPVRRSELLRLVCQALGKSNGREQEWLPSASVVSGSLDGRRGRILIAEDFEDNRFLMREYLKNTSYEITFAENGERAAALFQSQAFDLVLMDMQMPIMDGLTATRLIRETERDRGRHPTPVVALTANARKEDMDACRKAGCNAHVSKPVLPQKLRSVIEEHLRRPGEAGKPMPIATLPGLEEAARLVQ